MITVRAVFFCALLCLPRLAFGQATQPLVAIHDSELTRALETMPASGQTPTGPGTTGMQWWPADWRYHVMPDSLKEALRSDGTAFAVINDAQITGGALLDNGVPRFPILFSLASEAVRDDEIAALTNYVAKGGILFVGSSAFTRTPTGTSRGNFAFARELGVNMSASGLANWAQNSLFSKKTSNRLTSHIPAGNLTWRMPAHSEEIPWGTSPSHPSLAAHDIWQVRAGDATVLASGEANPLLCVKPLGKGFFIYHAAMQPLIGHGGFAPGMYAYGIFRNAIEWAFENFELAIPKLSPWPFQYDAAMIVRHDFENYAHQIAHIEASAQFEFNNGVKGDYFFTTGTLRDEMYRNYDTNAVVSSLRRAISSYGATIGPHNGGLKNPVNTALSVTDYDYWHWGPDEALNTSPPGFADGKAYAQASILASFRNIESWLSGLMSSNQRLWVSPYFNATREDSYDIQSQLNVKVIGDQKLTPFPHWTLSTRTPGKRYGCLTLPVSDWFVGGLVAQSLEPWHPPGVHTTTTLRNGIKFYYDLGALINFYSHTSSDGYGDAGSLASEYVTYCANTNLHPRLWKANSLALYQWWLQRSNAQVTAQASNVDNQLTTTLAITGTTHPDTSVEILVPNTVPFCALQVLANGAPAPPASFRLQGQRVKVRVGTTVTNVTLSYYRVGVASQIFSEKFDATTAPALPAGWTTSATGAQSAWVTDSTIADTPPNAAFSPAPGAVGVNQLVSPVVALPAGTGQLTFRHSYDLEANYDGAVLEIKIGSGTFADILQAGGTFNSGGYSGAIDPAYNNPLANRQAWTGNSGGFVTTIVDLPAAASGQPVQFRWRCGTDNSTSQAGWRIDTVSVNTSVCLCCGTSNSPPVLPGQSSQTINELATLNISNAAFDPDGSTQTLSYRLASAPAGATITSSGQVTWKPTEAQGPGTYVVTTVVTDSGSPPMSDTNSFNVNVLEVNARPTLPPQPDRTILESASITITNTASDPDLPANLITYALLNSPSGAAINPQGVITWTSSAVHAGSTYQFTTRATDNGTPALSATNSFLVSVQGATNPPTITAQPEGLTVVAGAPASFSVSATGKFLSYQWHRGGTALPQATNSTFMLAAALPADAGIYSVRVSNPYGSVVSSNANLAVIEPLLFTLQPQGHTNLSGTTAKLGASVSGTSPQFKWLKNGAALAPGARVTGTTSSNLTITALTESDSAIYSLVASNFAGAITSAPARLLVVTQGGEPELLFSDDFARSSISPWVNHSGSWSISSGVLNGSGKGQNYGFVNLSETWTNYSVQADIQFPSGGYGGGIGGRLNTSVGTHYAAWVFPEGSSGGARTLKLLKFKNWKGWSYGGATAPMKQVNLASVGTAWHTLKMALSNNVITVWFDDAQLISAIDTESTPLLNGTVCLGNGDTGTLMNFDNVEVYSLGSPAYVPPRPLIGSVSTTGNQVVLNWSAVTGIRYRVQYKGALETAGWTDAAPDIVATATTASFTNSIGPAPTRFFRVVVVP